MINRVKALCQKQKEIDQEIVKLAPDLLPYFEVIRKHRYRGWVQRDAQEITPYNFDLYYIRLSPDGITYQYYFSFDMKYDDIVLTVDDLSLTSQQLDAKLEEKYQQEEAEKKKQKREKEKADKKALEAGERRLYEELKRKYEEQK